jgi:hypothetical protein
MARSMKWMFAGLLFVPFAAAAQVTPGQWETTVTIKSMDMPGAPPQVAQMMKSRMAGGKPTRTSYCVTPEQAAKGPQEMLKQNPSCRFTKFSMAGGKIATEMTCKQDGGTMTAKSSGSYTAKAFNVNSNVAMSGQMSMRMASSNVGRWLGPCKGR